jgi:hypothetical protein
MYWIDQVQAESVVRSAQKLAGHNHDFAAATSALQRAAAAYRARPTPHDIAIARERYGSADR